MSERKPEPRLTPKQQAIKDLDRARSLLESHIHLATREWSPRVLLRETVQKHRWIWVVAAAVGGLLTVRFLRGSSTAKIGRDNSVASATKGGFIALILTPVLSMARQAALRYGTQFVQSYLRNHLSRHEGQHAPVREPTSHV